MSSARSPIMTEPIRNRIKAHRRVRAGDLVPHELNYRLHPEEQRSALEALYRTAPPGTPAARPCAAQSPAPTPADATASPAAHAPARHKPPSVCLIYAIP